jgi:hypothetical protein
MNEKQKKVVPVRKLALSRETLVQLNPSELREVAGGFTLAGCGSSNNSCPVLPGAPCRLD